MKCWGCHMKYIESEIVELKAEVVSDTCKEIIALPIQKAVLCILVFRTMGSCRCE